MVVEMRGGERGDFRSTVCEFRDSTEDSSRLAARIPHPIAMRLRKDGALDAGRVGENGGILASGERQLSISG
jgi:hypothetical protein